jgi:Tfp pilus assembly protein PilF
MGELEKARRDFERALRIDPAFVPSRANLAGLEKRRLAGGGDGRAD